MKNTGQFLLTVGLIMLVVGLVLPYLVGAAISPQGYNILQLGGLALAIVGMVLRRSGRKS